MGHVMTRAILALLVLAGCTTDRIQVDPETVAAHELVDFMWCTPDDGALCIPMINQGGQFILLQPGERIGDGTSLGGDTYDFIGVTVEAFSEDE